MKNNKKIKLIGAPYMYGKDSKLQSRAPDVLRKAGLYRAFEIANLRYKDIGDIKLPKLLGKDSVKTKLKYFREIREITNLVSQEIKMAISTKEIPILLGGDHSISIGALLGIAALRNDITLVYMDTHGDFHTSLTTPSGRIHGMSLALSIGLDKDFLRLYESKITYFDKNKTILFGAQKFDPGEKEAIVKNISLIDINFLMDHGIGKAVKSLLNQIKTKYIYISLDLDVIDREYAPGTDMAIYGALTYRELLYTLERLVEKHDVIGMDVVELSPDKDINGKTVSLAIESITTVLGRRVGAYELYMEEIDKI